MHVRVCSLLLAVFAILTCVTAAVAVAVSAVNVFDASTAAVVTSLTLHVRACVRVYVSVCECVCECVRVRGWGF